MVETGRYSVQNFEAYNELCEASIADVDEIHVKSFGETVEVEEMNTTHGEGAGNEVDVEDFEAAINAGYLSEK